jgi:hypothetical protein
MNDSYMAEQFFNPCFVVCYVFLMAIACFFRIIYQMSYSGICNVHEGFSMRVWLWISMAIPMVIEVLILILSMDLLYFDANTTDAITVATQEIPG